MIKLREYQNEAIQSIKEGFNNHFRQFIEMPTGAGKTITFLSYAKQNHKRILIIVPSTQLLNQVYESCLIFYEKKDISRRGDRHTEKERTVHICIINSIRAGYLDELAQMQFDLTIIDEAHHAQADSYKRFIKLRSQFFHERDMKILGVTATPDRSDGLLLKNLLYSCTYKVTTSELIEQGYLSDIEGFSVKTNIDISEVDNHNGDFSLNKLFNKINTDDRNKMIVDLCLKEMQNRKCLIFCINVKHSKEITRLLNQSGTSALHIDGSMKSQERNAILSSFRNGDTSVLCNCQILTEGFDEPSIDGIILSRPTVSRSLFIQMIGRGLRIYKGKKNCKIIDIVDNHRSIIGFNSIVEEVIKMPEIERFKSLKDIQTHLYNERLNLIEWSIEKTNLLEEVKYKNFEAMPCMIEYLNKNNIIFFEPISFDEASFLIWMDKLKKEYNSGNN